jgi:hypothetical protein
MTHAKSTPLTRTLKSSFLKVLRTDHQWAGGSVNEEVVVHKVAKVFKHFRMFSVRLIPSTRP